jgi:hypothetical protein
LTWLAKVVKGQRICVVEIVVAEVAVAAHHLVVDLAPRDGTTEAVAVTETGTVATAIEAGIPTAGAHQNVRLPAAIQAVRAQTARGQGHKDATDGGNQCLQINLNFFILKTTALLLLSL